jgi:hypothetical protein
VGNPRFLAPMIGDTSGATQQGMVPRSQPRRAVPIRHRNVYRRHFRLWPVIR